MKSILRLVVAVALHLAVVSSPAFAAEASPVVIPAANGEVEGAVLVFYRALHDHDEAAAASFISADGFSEFPSSGSALQQKNRDAVTKVIAAGTTVDVRFEEMHVDMLSADAALVTGYRIGVVGASTSAPQKRRMSMVWVRQAGQWRLFHAHFSASE